MKSVASITIFIFYTIFTVGCDPVIETPLGKIQGITHTTASEKLVDVFLGIPYAKPPVGPERFLPPKKNDPWQDILLAKAVPNSCVQFIDKVRGKLFENHFDWVPSKTPSSEDCLYLNVWVPNPKPRKAAVMVWIHGGGFNTGSSTNDLYSGETLAAEENVIVVSMNYRLNVFGFLNIKDTEVSGNMGLLDQVAALKWIQENIAHFGGDPNSVTIFGESAGGASVALHVLSSKTHNLFKSVIIQSGSPPMGPRRTILPNEIVKAQGVAEMIATLHCSNTENNKTAVIDCLRKVSTEDLVSHIPEHIPFLFGAVYDGVYLKNDPEILFQQKHFQQVSVLLGTTTEDGSVMAVLGHGDLFPLEKECHLTRSDFHFMLKKKSLRCSNVIHNAIDFVYTDWKDPEDPVEICDQAIKMSSDIFVTCATNTMVKHFAEAGINVYQYQFSHIPSNSKLPKWMGSAHGDEIAFVFGKPLDPKNGFNEQEVQLSKNMMHYWANFAKYNNPNGKEDSDATNVPFQWPQYTLYGKDYLNLSTNISTGRGIRLRECAFWDNEIPELNRLTSLLRKKGTC